MQEVYRIYFRMFDGVEAIDEDTIVNIYKDTFEDFEDNIQAWEFVEKYGVEVIDYGYIFID